jgi:hypothetical protein
MLTGAAPPCDNSKDVHSEQVHCLLFCTVPLKPLHKIINMLQRRRDTPADSNRASMSSSLFSFLRSLFSFSRSCCCSVPHQRTASALPAFCASSNFFFAILIAYERASISAFTLALSNSTASMEPILDASNSNQLVKTAKRGLISSHHRPAL